MMLSRNRIKKFACLSLNEVLSLKCFGIRIKDKLESLTAVPITDKINFEAQQQFIYESKDEPKSEV